MAGQLLLKLLNKVTKPKLIQETLDAGPVPVLLTWVLCANPAKQWLAISIMSAIASWAVGRRAFCGDDRLVRQLQLLASGNGDAAEDSMVPKAKEALELINGSAPKRPAGPRPIPGLCPPVCPSQA